MAFVMDFRYLAEWLERFTELLEGPDLQQTFEMLRQELEDGEAVLSRYLENSNP
jgi:hypothetical protein